jgi:UDP-N-acetylmuramate dehydrogenase
VLEQPLEGVPLGRFTTLGVGGPARYFALAADADALERWLYWGQQRGLECLVLGWGSNVVVADGGYRGLVIVNRRRSGARRLDVQVKELGPEVHVSTDAALGLRDVACWACEKGFHGLEWATGIPGTIGGAIADNAGAFGGSMERLVTGATVIGPSGSIQMPAEGLGFGYRSCSYLPATGSVVSRAHLSLLQGDARDCLTQAADCQRRRRETQPAGRSAGSVFRNPPDAAAGALIEECGLKGKRVGGAIISRKHANFILNRGGATAGDVISLMRLARRAVHERFGMLLEPEVRLVGDVNLEDV